MQRYKCILASEVKWLIERHNSEDNCFCTPSETEFLTSQFRGQENTRKRMNARLENYHKTRLFPQDKRIATRGETCHKRIATRGETSHKRRELPQDKRIKNCPKNCPKRRELTQDKRINTRQENYHKTRELRIVPRIAPREEN